MADFRKRGRNWYFKFTDGDGRRVERRGCPNRRATEEMARDAETEAAWIRAGLTDPKAERLAAAERRAIKDHLAEFAAALDAKGGDPKHVRQTRTYASRILDSAAIRAISDLAPSAVMAALGTLKERGLSARTLNAHVTAIKQFARWLMRDGRSLDNPLSSLGKLPEAADRRLVRRPLSEAELRRLIDATRTAPPWQGMDGGRARPTLHDRRRDGVPPVRTGQSDPRVVPP
jgi:hypothetical protein